MLGIPTPNFCDASSEFDGFTTTGHPDEGWRRRGVMRFVVLASRPQRGSTTPFCRRLSKPAALPPRLCRARTRIGAKTAGRLSACPFRSGWCRSPRRSVPSSSDHWPAWLTKVARPPPPPAWLANAGSFLAKKLANTNIGSISYPFLADFTYKRV